MLPDSPTCGEAAPVAAPPPQAFDAAIVSELEACVGRTRLRDLLGCLRDEIATRLLAPLDARETLERDAHILVSASGTLGFLPLSQACADLGRACREGLDPSPALALAGQAARRARAAIDGMLAEAA